MFATRGIIIILSYFLIAAVQGEISRQECINQGGTVVGDIGNGAIFKADYVCDNDDEPPSDTVVAGPGEPIASDGEVCCGGTGKLISSQQGGGGGIMGILPINNEDEDNDNNNLPQLPLVCVTDEDCQNNGMITSEERTKNGDEYYCSKGVCRPFGFCDTLIDCYNPSNSFIEIFCIGEKVCRDNSCVKDCTTNSNDCPKGFDFVNCLVSPCANECNSETEAVSCTENYCGTCNALWFDAAGNHVCQDQTIYPPPNNYNNNNNEDVCGSPTDSCMNGQNYQECIDLKEEGCASILVKESCPLQFECEQQPVVVDNDGGGNVDVCGSPTDPCMNEQNYQECINLKEQAAGCASILVMESCPVQFGCEELLPPVGGDNDMDDENKKPEQQTVDSPLNNNNDDDNNNNKDDVVCGSPTDPCMNEQNYQECIILKEKGGCASIIVMESCPVQFGCEKQQPGDDMDDNEKSEQQTVNSPSNNNNPINGNDLCGSPTDSCINEQNYKECITLKEKGCVPIMVMLSCPAQFVCGELNNDGDDPSDSSSFTMKDSKVVLIVNFVVVAVVSFSFF